MRKEDEIKIFNYKIAILIKKISFVIKISYNKLIKNKSVAVSKIKFNKNKNN